MSVHTCYHCGTDNPFEGEPKGRYVVCINCRKSFDHRAPECMECGGLGYHQYTDPAAEFKCEECKGTGRWL